MGPRRWIWGLFLHTRDISNEGQSQVLGLGRLCKCTLAEGRMIVRPVNVYCINIRLVQPPGAIYMLTLADDIV